MEITYFCHIFFYYFCSLMIGYCCFGHLSLTQIIDKNIKTVEFGEWMMEILNLCVRFYCNLIISLQCILFFEPLHFWPFQCNLMMILKVFLTNCVDDILCNLCSFIFLFNVRCMLGNEFGWLYLRFNSITFFA